MLHTHSPGTTSLSAALPTTVEPAEAASPALKAAGIPQAETVAAVPLDNAAGELAPAELAARWPPDGPVAGPLSLTKPTAKWPPANPAVSPLPADVPAAATPAAKRTPDRVFAVVCPTMATMAAATELPPAEPSFDLPLAALPRASKVPVESDVETRFADPASAPPTMDAHAEPSS